MHRTAFIAASLLLLSACGGSPEAVGENSADSIKTTAVGEVVATPSATPSATPTAEVMNGADDTLDATTAAEATGNAM